jgi:hypothetical protein
VYGDFKDLETGQNVIEASSRGEGEGEGKADAYQKGTQKPEAKILSEKRQEKKERQKAGSNASYDGGKTYYDEVKDAMQEQLDFNKSELQGKDYEPPYAV